MVYSIFLLLCFTSKAFSTTISGQTIRRFQGAEWGNETEGLIKVDKYFGSLCQDPQAKLTVEDAGSAAIIACEVKQMGPARMALKAKGGFYCDPNGSAIFEGVANIIVNSGRLSLQYGSTLETNGSISINQAGSLTLTPYAMASIGTGALLNLSQTHLANYGNITLANDAVLHINGFSRYTTTVSNHGTIKLGRKALFLVRFWPSTFPTGFSGLPNAFSKIQLGELARLQVTSACQLSLYESATLVLAESADMYMSGSGTPCSVAVSNSNLTLERNSRLKLNKGTLVINPLSSLKISDSASVLMSPGAGLTIQSHAELKVKPNVWLLMAAKSGLSVLTNSTCEIGQFLYVESNTHIDLGHETTNPNGIACSPLY